MVSICRLSIEVTGTMTDFDRREFMKLSAAAAVAASCPGLVTAMEFELGGKDFHQIRTFHARDRKPYLCTMCPYFDGGFTYAEGGEVLKAEGNPHQCFFSRLFRLKY